MFLRTYQKKAWLKPGFKTVVLYKINRLGLPHHQRFLEFRL